MNDIYDLIVIGGGTAGLVSASGGASLGAKVALIEYDRLGGDCLYHGCVPTKTLVKSASVAKTIATSEDFGVKSSAPEIDFPKVMSRMRSVIEKAGEADDPQRFRDMGVDVRLGEYARFVSPDTVEVGGERLRARSFIIATGSKSTAPPVDGLEGAGYLTNVEVLQLEELPESMTVLGSGPIGCEFAQIFARFGVKITMVSDTAPLPKEDPEVGRLMKSVLEADGITVHEGFLVDSVSVEGGEKVMVAKNESGREVTVRSEEILIAAGRAPVTGTLALENAGVEVQKSGITVDEHLQTTNPNIYAAGDVTGVLPFTHVAEFQAKTALRNALFPLGPARSKIDYSAVPWTTFTSPEVARVGLTEDEARSKYEDVKVWRKDFTDVDRAMADGETVGFEKIVCRGNGEIVGAHIVGVDAGNIIQELVLAMRKGLKVGDISQTVHVYPTLVQVNQRAADGFYREKLFDVPASSVFRTFFEARKRLGRVREVWRKK